HDGRSVVQLLLQLANKSLITADERGYYRQLETIRRYGEELLRESGEEASIRRRHRDWYLGMAQNVLAGMQEAVAEGCLWQLDREHDNLRSALSSSITLADPDQKPHPNGVKARTGRLGSSRDTVLRG